jgi:hypothetical protein
MTAAARNLALSALLFVLAISSFAQQAPIDLTAAADYFADAKAASDRDAGKLWGVRLYGPILFVDPQSRTVVTNQADAEGKLKQQGTLWVGTLPPEVGIANTATKWAGVNWTMVMWGALSPYRQDHVRLTMHECFHRVQDGLGLPPSDAINNQLDTMDGRIWLQLEWRALELALRTTGPQRKQAVGDALYFRNYRRQLFPNAAKTENALESNEGVAEYTGIKLAAGSADEAALLAAIDLSQAYRRQTFVRSFAYISGPAYGLLLDAAKPNWRTGLKGGFDFGMLLASAYNVAPPAKLTSAEADRRARRYDGSDIFAVEKKREERRQRELADARKRVIDGPVLSFSPGSAFSFSFNPNNLVAIDDNRTVYPTLEISDEWGILKVEGGAMLVREKGFITRVVVPAPAPGATKGDGWELDLKPGWKLSSGPRPGDVTLTK